MAYTFDIIRSNQEEFNFLNQFSADNVSYFRKIVTECVLATDLAKSMQWIASAKISLTASSSSSSNNKSYIDGLVGRRKSQTSAEVKPRRISANEETAGISFQLIKYLF